MTKIFISHSSKDTEFALQVAKALTEVGIDVWIMEADIPAGMKWSTAIQHGLDQCEAMIVIISPDAMASLNVEDEWQYYFDKKKRVFPVRWKPAEVHFQLSRIQYIDFHKQEFKEAFRRLSAELEHSGVVTASLKGEIHTLRANDISVKKEEWGAPKPGILRTEDILLPLIEWVEISSGKVTMEKGGYLKAKTIVEVDAFTIAKYPTTNAQFALFVEAGGYQQKQWWTEAGWRQKEQEQWQEPRYWWDKKWNSAEMPVVGVSWYEVAAFCQWASAATNQHIVLPCEQEWQRAAQGDDERKYPWGNAWNCQRCNNSVKPCANDQTTEVKAYEDKGVSPFGVVDMVGNSWEWCRTGYETGSHEMDGSDVRVLRGGSWYDYELNIFRVTHRYRDRPQDRGDNLGFRVSLLK